VPIVEHLDHLRNAPTEVSVTPESGGKTVIDTKTVIDSKRVLPSDGKTFLYPGNSDDKRWSSFAAATGDFTWRGSDITTAAVTSGVDYRFTDHVVVGTALTYAHTSGGLDAGGSVETNSAVASLYGMVYDRGFYVDAVLGFGYHHYDTERDTTSGFAHGETDGGSIHGLIGGGYEWYVDGFIIGPIARLRYTGVATDSFTENDSLTPTHVTSGNLDALQSAVGLKVAHPLRMHQVIVTPELRVQWAHEYLDTEGVINTREPFTPLDTGLGSDSVLLDAGTWVQFSPTLAVFGYYRADIGRSHYSSHTVGGGLQISF